MARRSLSIASIASIVLGAGLAFASVDYSGTWVLDRGKSDPVAPKAGKKGRGSAAGDGGVTLVVRQSGSELAVTRRPSNARRAKGLQQTFKLDGSESVLRGARNGEMRAKMSWRDAKLVIEGTEKATTKRGEVEMKVVEEWSLADDGKVLTIKTTRTGRKRDRTVTQVFNRQ